MQLLGYTPTPVYEIHNQLLDDAGMRLLIKREDLNHEHISGNKWWKLKYNFEEAFKQKKKTVLTFGGAYSNHIYATAAACFEVGLKSIGIIRGEETQPLNNTLAFAKNCGMHIHYVSREAYRNKTHEDFITKLHEQFGSFYLIPEGGTNDLAIQGTTEFGRALSEIDFDYLCLSVGTGGTIAGIISGLNNRKKIIGFPVLKGGDFLKHDIENLLREKSFNNWSLDSSYHHGGYAKTTTELLDFIKTMKHLHNLPLDHVYTGKLLWAVFDYIKNKKFKPDSIILVLHTGGLQGTTS